jgi:hypothetical protein
MCVLWEGRTPTNREHYPTRRLIRGESVEITRDVTTRGVSIREENVTGYRWEPCHSPGDTSATTGGRIQGYTEPAYLVVQVGGLRLGASRANELLLYRGEGLEPGLTVQEAIDAGLVCLRATCGADPAPVPGD